MTIYQKAIDEQKQLNDPNESAKKSTNENNRTDKKELKVIRTRRLEPVNSDGKEQFHYYEYVDSPPAIIGTQNPALHDAERTSDKILGNETPRKSTSKPVSRRNYPKDPGVALRSQAMCGLFGPCLALIALLIALQAAAFIFLHYQLDQAEGRCYKQQETLHRQLAELMEQFRKLKTESAHQQSIRGVRLLYDGQKAREDFDIISDDEELEEDFPSGAHDYLNKVEDSSDKLENAGISLSLTEQINNYLQHQKWKKYKFKQGEDLENEDFSGDEGPWNDSEDFDPYQYNFNMKNDAILMKGNGPKDLNPHENRINDELNKTVVADEDPSINEVFIPSKISVNKKKLLVLQNRFRLRRDISRQQYPDYRLTRLSREEHQSRYHNPANRYYGHDGASYWSPVDYERNAYRRVVGRTGRGVDREYDPGPGRPYNAPSGEYNVPIFSNSRDYSASAGGRGYTLAGGSNIVGVSGDYNSGGGSLTGGYNSVKFVRDYPQRDVVDHNQGTTRRDFGATGGSEGYLSGSAARRLDNNEVLKESARVGALQSPLVGAGRDYTTDARRQDVEDGRDVVGRPQRDQETRDDDSEDGDPQAGVTEVPDPEDAERSWLQLTSYAKIPYNAIEQFCQRTRSSCPPGPEGPKGVEGIRGLVGAKGELGDKGHRGDTGPTGPQGFTGLPGPAGRNGRKGEVGNTGITGLDGRDGLPGEPGLDGIPGRNGLDGIPGVDGIPGFDGLPGRDGRNGTEGALGPRGFKGDQGVQGPRGIPGPRGRTGKSGKAGTPGIPGISTWMVNGSVAQELLIPPAIPGPTSLRPSGPLLVREGDHVRLRCAATGRPAPRVEWRRDDGAAIPTGRWKDATVNEPVLNLTHVRRDHTGYYHCEAYNGVPPNAFKTFRLEVHFEPYLKVKEWKVGAFNGSSARLECLVESYPTALTYWENRHGVLLENSDKHRVYNVPDTNFVWRSTMVLLMTNITSTDYGNYYCIAKNELAITRGSVEVHEIDPSRFKPATGATAGLSFGPEAPNYSELFGDLCPPQPVCEECPPPPPQTHGSGFLYCLNIAQFGNDTYPGYNNRSLDCKLSAIGKPVFNRHTNDDYGSWLRDPKARNLFYATRYYTTDPDQPTVLFEFATKDIFRKDIPSKNYSLPFPFTGNSHVLYNGSFYFHQKNSSNLVKYEILTNTVSSQHIPRLAFQGQNYLYTDGRDYLDLSVDENGLWAIYGLAETNNNTIIAKIDPVTLTIEYSWNISLSHHKFGEMFITCGVLYGIDSSTERETKIRFALDLYTTKVLDVDLTFTNPFRKTTMLGYNPKAKEIYSWDSGNQLNYPVVYIDIGYHTGDDEGDAILSIPDYELDFEVVRNTIRNAPRRGQGGWGSGDRDGDEEIGNDVYIPGG